MEPLIGVSSEYSSNPYLLATGGSAVSDAAILLNAPTLYDADALHFALVPSLRYSDSGSYASLNSNYIHVNASAQFLSDLNSLTISSNFGRDSSLFQNGLSNNGVGVRSDSSSAGLDWQHGVTERSQLELNGSWSRVLYDQGAEPEGLVDYRYVSLGGSGNYDLTERNKIKLLLGAGEYQAIDGTTKSKNLNVQLGFERKLTEIWSLSSTLGYAKSNNTEYFFEDAYLLGTVESTQKGPVYSTSLTRRGEQVTFTLNASRAYRPSGFEFLSRQDVAELSVNYLYSERWTFGAKGNFTKIATPLTSDELLTQRYFSGAVSADWRWTPTWIISLKATWVDVKYQAPPLSAACSGVGLEISRQFLRIEL